MMNEKSRILIITNLYPLPWEPNRAVFNKQQFSFLSEKYDVYLLIPIAWVEYFKHRKELKNTSKVHYFPYFYLPKIGRRLYPWFMYLSLLFSSYKWIKSLNVKLFLASWGYPEGVAVSKIAALFKLPFFIKVHGNDINIHGDFPSRANQIVHAANNSQGVISVSKALSDRMVEIGIKQNLIHVIYNGVDRKKFFYDETVVPKSKSLLFIGNLKKAKGVIELISSFNVLCNKYPELTLTYVGEGEMTHLLKQKVHDYGLSDRVSLLGNIEHHLLPHLIQETELLVLPSYNEGVPNVILEALACGTPVVATSVGGIPEVVIENVSGILCASPTVDDIQKGIDKALVHQWDRKEISKTSEQFDWNTNVMNVSRLFEQ